MICDLKIEGKPVGKQRPRVVTQKKKSTDAERMGQAITADDYRRFLKKRKGPKARAYTPSKTLKYENAIALKARQQVKEPTEEDVSVRIIHTASDRRQADLDNIVKTVLDGLQGVVFQNDNQVQKIEIVRVFKGKGTDELRIIAHVMEELI